jgi:hypothetical protein
MGLGDYLLGVALLALVVGSLGFAAWRARARLLPGWTGAPARVAEAVLAIAALVLVQEALGTVGLLKRAPFVLACVALAAAVAWWSGRARVESRAEPDGAEPEPGAAPPQPVHRRLAALALAACGLVALAWLDRTYFAVQTGMNDPDTVWYHLPYAARWIQDGSITALHFTSYEPLTTFYPSNPSLVHSAGLLAFGTDVLSPYVNLGWLALALVAGWAAGRPRGVEPVTLLGAALVAGLPIVVSMQAGSAKDDIPGISLTIAAVALLVNGWPRRAPVAIAGVAAGLLLGTKLSMVAPALLLTLAVVVAAPRGRRLALSAAWLAPMLAVGSFWYLRNLARTGNPVPWFEGGPLGLNRPELEPYTEEHVKGSIADYATDDGFWGDYFFPSAADAFGPLWWALLALAAIALVAVLVRGRVPIHRALAAAGLAMAVAYVLTPGGAGGSPSGLPHLVLWSMRYLTPALAVGLVLAPLVLGRRGARAWVPAAVLAVLLVAVQFAGGTFELWGARPSAAAVAAAIPFLLAAAAVALGARIPRVGPRAMAGAVAALTIAALAVGWKAQDVYFDQRYTEPSNPLAGPYAWAADQEGLRIGIVGFYMQYPLYGERLDNHVQYVGHEGGSGAFRPANTCPEWREALNAGDYDYVITAPFNFPWGDHTPPPEQRWTANDPRAHRVARWPGNVTLVRLDGPLDPDGCPPGTLDPVPPRNQESGPRRPS